MSGKARPTTSFHRAIRKPDSTPITNNMIVPVLSFEKKKKANNETDGTADVESHYLF